MLINKLIRCSSWLLGNYHLVFGEAQPDAPKLLMKAADKIQRADTMAIYAEAFIKNKNLISDLKEAINNYKE